MKTGPAPATRGDTPTGRKLYVAFDLPVRSPLGETFTMATLRKHPITTLTTAGLLIVGLTASYFSSPTPAEAAENNAEVSSVSDSDSKTDAVATLAGGCFWCTEAVFERMEGVGDVVSGYIGGQMPNPDYKSVTTGMTGHAEAVEIHYDSDKVSFEELLEVFFKTHDPTTLNRQGADIGTQYRSSIFFQDEEQKQAAAEIIRKLNEGNYFRDPVVTKLEPATQFYPAEEYHQDYFRKNPRAGYCRAVVAKKVRKFNQLFGDKAKKSNDD